MKLMTASAFSVLPVEMMRLKSAREIPAVTKLNEIPKAIQESSGPG
jgi:hypothetical protein